MAYVALMPESDVFQCGNRIAAQDACETREPFPRDGIAFVRHRAAAFLAFGERLLGFEHFCALQMAKLNRPALNARADDCKRSLKFGVDIALDYLRGNGRRAQL